MIHIRKILYPTDFSASADHALSHAVYLAQKYSAELHMLHVVVLHEEDPYNPAHHFPEKSEIAQKLQTSARDQMNAAVAGRQIEDIDLHKVQRRNVSAAPAIVEYAEEEDIDLIVIGTHGRRGLRHLFQGSVAEEVVRAAPCAVLSVRSATPPKPLAEIQRVLAPIDFSAASKETLVVARQVAANYGANLQMLHVMENVMHPAFYNMGATSLRDLQPDLEERAERALSDLFEATEGPAVGAEFFAEEGHAAHHIVDFARKHASDIIVIATHGLTGMEDFLLGSVTEKVVRRAPCPVLIVRAFSKSLVRS